MAVPHTSAAHEVEPLERRGWDALSGPHGAAFYAEVMADDGLMVFPGMVLDKQRTLRAMAAEPPWSTYELADVRVIEATPDSAIVTYRASAQRAGEERYEARMSSTYVRRDGRWRLILHQQTPTPSGR
jgi:uncharacterized protein (TIGR02246 family)